MNHLHQLLILPTSNYFFPLCNIILILGRIGHGFVRGYLITLAFFFVFLGEKKRLERFSDSVYEAVMANISVSNNRIC